MKLVSNKIFLTALIISIFIPGILSVSGLTFTLNQSSYYFLVNNPAILMINITNPDNIDISGQITYTITQKIQTGNSMMQSSNSNSQGLTIKKDQPVLMINLGTMNNPGELDLTINYDYKNKKSIDMTASLLNIKIYFIQNQNDQKQNNEQKQSTSTSKQEQQKQQEDKEKQQQEQARKAEEQANNLNNRIQNNQQFNDPNQLKQQIQKELSEDAKNKEEFKKSLEQNKEFQENIINILKQGYNFTSADLNAINNTSGDFNIQFHDNNNNTAQFTGSMLNNNLTLKKTSYELNKANLKSLVEKNETYQKYSAYLKKKSYNESSWQINDDNKSDILITIPYKNKNNQLSSITARVIDNNVSEIQLKESSSFFWLYILALAVTIAFIVLKFVKKTKSKKFSEIKESIIEFDYKKESLLLIEKAKKIFNIKDPINSKEAYSLVSQGIRLYYSYKLGLKKELTNTTLIKTLKKNNIDYKNTLECLNLCSLVEFAKYTINESDFKEIIKLGEKIIQ